MAHRDYASPAAIQVSLFVDRLNVSNPGELLPPLTPELLRRPHRSIARNHRICEALFLARYIEKFGTGTLIMIKETAANGLAEPQFEQSPGEFLTTVWRDWLTDQFLTQLPLNARQDKAVSFLKVHRRITNADYQKITGASESTALRDLNALGKLGIIAKVGGTGRSAHYTITTKPAKNPSKPS